jgi:hypothetical protein
LAGWTSDDAWVLAAIVAQSEETGDSLSRVIAHADMLNHLVLVEPEFTDAIGRLVGAGLIHADPAADRYWLTEPGREMRGSLDGHGLFAWSDVLMPKLRRLPPPQPHTWVLPSGAFDAAVQRYLRGKF